MATGFAPYLLKHIAEVAKENTPQYKMEAHGTLALLKSQKSADILRVGTPEGHKKTVVIKKKQRATKDMTDTTASCTATNVPAYTEDTVSLDVFRQFAFHIPDETIAKYAEDASKTVALGQPGTSLMNEFYDELLTSANAILQGVNDDLLTLMVAAFGTHRATGLNAAVTVNIPLDGTQNNLSAGLTKILSDYKNNGGMGRPQILGSGLFNNFMLQQASKSADQSGFDTKIMAAGVEFYHDLAASTIMGANQIGVYQPNAVQLVEYLQYKGFKAGVKPGASVFGTVILPMGLENIPVEFDFQLKYNDCAQDFTDAVAGTTISLEKGYNLILSKTCGLWTIPSTAYRATDPLTGNRGSLRYTITNA